MMQESWTMEDWRNEVEELRARLEAANGVWKAEEAENQRLRAELGKALNEVERLRAEVRFLNEREFETARNDALTEEKE